MFDNWIKSVEDMCSYKYWKSEVFKMNKRVLKFWKDAFDDLTSHRQDKDKD
jgi:hypothetical protein